MNWHVPSLDKLAGYPCCGYQANGLAATEPTALAALALAGWGRSDAARVAADWLAELQASDGSVGVRSDEPTPRWPTGLAVVAWLAVDEGGSRFAAEVDRALDWILAARSKPLPRGGAVQHDTSLVAWPWVSGTHAWVEPTALNVLALKASGKRHHQRTREAVRLLLDRQLPSGGCNYGNTRVLGRQLRPHLLPTGLAMLALNGEDRSDPRLRKSLSFLANHVSADTPVLSLGWALLGLAAHGRWPPEANDWLARISERMRPGQRPPIQTALMLLAALAEDAPLAKLCTLLDRPGQ
ncbi:MAG: hypothetical protein ACC628_04090 [Pirellulaceae bacterium]